MKRILIGISLSLVLVAATMAAVGVFLPKQYAFERSVFIEAEPAAVFPYINDLERWQEWTYWTGENVDGLEITYGETTAGKGASQTWVENDMNGKLLFTDSVPNERVSFETVIENYPPIHSSIVLESTTEKVQGTDGEEVEVSGTRVTWKSNGRLGNDPLSAWMGILAPSMMGKQYDHGLAALKKHFSTTAAQTNAPLDNGGEEAIDAEESEKGTDDNSDNNSDVNPSSDASTDSDDQD